MDDSTVIKIFKFLLVYLTPGVSWGLWCHAVSIFSRRGRLNSLPASRRGVTWTCGYQHRVAHLLVSTSWHWHPRVYARKLRAYRYRRFFVGLWGAGGEKRQGVCSSWCKTAVKHVFDILRLLINNRWHWSPVLFQGDLVPSPESAICRR